MMSGKSSELFSESIKAGSRTYFFDVKESSDGVKYLVVSESRARKSGFEHNRVMVFEENFDTFKEVFAKAMRFIEKL
jgi:hypothetical protein